MDTKNKELLNQIKRGLLKFKKELLQEVRELVEEILNNKEEYIETPNLETPNLETPNQEGDKPKNGNNKFVDDLSLFPDLIEENKSRSEINNKIATELTKKKREAKFKIKKCKRCKSDFKAMLGGGYLCDRCMKG